MIKKTVLLIFAMVILQCGMGGKAVAQTTDPCLAFTTWWFDAPIPPGWFNYAPYPGAFVYLIAAHLASPGCAPPPTCPCTPPGAGGPGGGGPSPAGPGGSGGAPPPGPASTPQAARPIYLTTGDVYIDQMDASIPGLGGGLSLRRRWNSLWPANEIASSIGLFGPNWRSTYEERIFMDSDNYLTYARADGGYWKFGLGPSGAFIVAAPASASATLTQSASNWVLVFQNGEQRQFSLTTGLLTAILDRNGNTTQLTYDASNRLTTVTDPASRHLYFNYQNGSSFLVTSVTSDFGFTVSYAYDAQNRLSQITEPDLTTISYTYNTQSQITQVTDSNGKVLESHTYDSTGRGLTASQANGVNAVTVTYPQ